MLYMAFKNFNDYFNIHKRNIQVICSSLKAQSNCKIEYEDLYQEAVLKLLEIYRDKKPLDFNFTKQSIKNHLLDYIKKNTDYRIAGFDVGNLFNSLRKINN